MSRPNPDPCPLCGDQPDIYKSASGAFREPPWAITCIPCGLTLCGRPGESRRIVVDRWNRRRQMLLAAGVFAAQRALIDWYADEMERSHFDDADVPPALRALEVALEAAQTAIPCPKGDSADDA